MFSSIRNKSVRARPLGDIQQWVKEIGWDRRDSVWIRRVPFLMT